MLKYSIYQVDQNMNIYIYIYIYIYTHIYIYIYTHIHIHPHISDINLYKLLWSVSFFQIHIFPYIYIYIYIYVLAHWPCGLKCLPMAWETGVQSQVKSYQRLKKWYLMPPCLTLRSRVKLSNPEKWVVPSPKPWCSSYGKGSFQVALDYSLQCSPTGVKHYGKGIYACHSHNTKLFELIEHSDIR